MPLAEVFTGEAARAVHARAVLHERGLRSGPDALPVVGPPMTLVTTGRTDGGQVRFILAVQSAGGARSGLVLLAAGEDQGAFRIRHLSRVLTGRGAAALPSRGDSSLAETDGRIGDLVRSYAASLGSSTASSFEPDDYAKRVRGRLAALRDRIGRSGQVSQQHRLLPETLVDLRGPEGDSIVLAGLERTTTLSVRAGAHPRLPGNVAVLAGGRSSVLQQAQWTTLAFLTWVVPDAGRPRLIAASEQDVSASGH